mgnify:CR=1 FL=1
MKIPKEAIPLLHFYIPISSSEIKQICEDVGVTTLYFRCGHECCREKPHETSIDDLVWKIQYSEVEGFGYGHSGLTLFTTLGNNYFTEDLNPEIYKHPVIQRLKLQHDKIPPTKVFM